MSNSIDSNDKLSVIIATSRQAILQESAFVFSCLCFFEDLIIPLDFCNVYHIKMLNQNANRLHNEKKKSISFALYFDILTTAIYVYSIT